MTADALLAVARAEVGYTESGGRDGRSGNVTKYWAELAPSMQGQPWCAAFVQWCIKHSNSPTLPVGQPWYCPSYVDYAKAHGLWDESGHYQPGDLVLFSFDRSGVAEHIEIVVSDDGTNVHDIGGNTSPGTTGSQANGGVVAARTRSHGTQLLGVLAYSRLLAAVPVKQPQTAPRQHDTMTPTVPEDDVLQYLIGKTTKYPTGAVFAYGPAGKRRITPEEDNAVAKPLVAAGRAEKRNVPDGVLDTIADVPGGAA